MYKRRHYQRLAVACLALAVTNCKTPELAQKTPDRTVPGGYTATAPAPAAAVTAAADTTTAAQLRWEEFFPDPHLQALVGAALQNNQELNITQQELEIARNDVRARKGEYLPFVGLGARAGAEKVGRYTVQGSSEANLDIEPGRATPDPVPNFQFGAFASWEVDIWHKLRNARKAAAARYLASVEGRNFMVTNLIAEIATAYYELLALDQQRLIVEQSIALQRNALDAVRLQMQAAKVTELAVRRFEAQVQHTRGLQFGLQQRLIETENRLNYLAGRYPQPIARPAQAFDDLRPPLVSVGQPGQLLRNRPDIRQAEQLLVANQLDVRVARASFYPSLSLEAGLGVQAFNAALLTTFPESLLAGLGGSLAGPLLNRNGLKATYYSANARQTQAVYKYEQTLRNAYLEVANQLASIDNLARSYDAKTQEVAALSESVAIADLLFKSARADYVEVLLTQREALEARFDLVENRVQQLNATVNVYRALGGGGR